MKFLTLKKIVQDEVKGFKHLGISAVKGLYAVLIKQYGCPDTQETVEALEEGIQEQLFGNVEIEFEDDILWEFWEEMTPETLKAK